MTVSKGKPWQEVLAEQLGDPEFRREWERTAVARAVAIWLCRYRAEHDLTQEALAERVGMKQSAIARLELGETEPKLSTLLRLARALDTPLNVHLAPGEPEVTVALVAA